MEQAYFIKLRDEPDGSVSFEVGSVVGSGFHDNSVACQILKSILPDLWEAVDDHNKNLVTED